jgi:hypothetical protein
MGEEENNKMVVWIVATNGG